jgi:tetratricopeptide (TPR) repeat protein
MESSQKIARSKPRGINGSKKLLNSSLVQSRADHKASESFMRQGESRLLHGDLNGVQFFDLAARLDPSNSGLYYKQGLALLEYSSERGEERGLLLSCKRFKMSTKMQCNFFEAWHAWGDALFHLGQETGEHHYYLEAEKKLKRAILISSNQPQDVLSDLYWLYGSTWSMLSEKSGEAGDMHLAMEAFSQAAEHLDDLPCEFWLDYGHVALELGKCINDTGVIGKAINCYKNAVSISISSAESWLSLAEAMSLLYTYSHDEDHFSQANECYATVAQLSAEDVGMWLSWAELLILSGKVKTDAKRIRSSIDKCHKAFSCDHDDPRIVAVWVEALALLGTITERVDLIQEAQNKLCEILDEADGYTEIWYAYGVCLQALATYFNDLDYYYQAIEKYQEGLSIDRTAHKLWHGLATCYTTAAQIEMDPKIFERAHKFYQRAIALQVNNIYLYDYAVSLSKCGEAAGEQKTLELSTYYFEQALARQKNAVYLHPDWLFNYAVTLDQLGEYIDEPDQFVKAIEILNHVLMVDPEFPEVHYRLGLAYNHYADFIGDSASFKRSQHHFRLAQSRDEENDQIILEWALSLVNFAQHIGNGVEADQYYREAEYKMTQAARLGSVHAYYHLGCLYSIIGQFERAFRFIKKAHEFEALPALHELLDDDWLEGLRSTESFRNFIADLVETSE